MKIQTWVGPEFWIGEAWPSGPCGSNNDFKKIGINRYLSSLHIGKHLVLDYDAMILKWLNSLISFTSELKRDIMLNILEADLYCSENFEV